MYEMRFEMKRFFFDRLAVEERLSNREARAMAKIGSFIRTSARRSMRRRKKFSEPGQSPSAHSRDVASLKTILFAYEPSEHRLVVGPVLLNKSKPSGGFWLPFVGEQGRDRKGQFAEKRVGGIWIEDIEIDTTVPALHEYGGTARAIINGENVTLNYPARPFMGPALEKESSNHKLIEAWRALL